MKITHKEYVKRDRFILGGAYELKDLPIGAYFKVSIESDWWCKKISQHSYNSKHSPTSSEFERMDYGMNVYYIGMTQP